MNPQFYRYRFRIDVPLADIEASLALARLATQALHGQSQTRIDVACGLEPLAHACIIEATTHVGQDFNRLFVGFVSHEFGEDAFQVARLVPEAIAGLGGSDCQECVSDDAAETYVFEMQSALRLRWTRQSHLREVPTDQCASAPLH
jgi:hypothetical protein